MSKILITGGSGFIGSYLTQVLLQREYEVMVFDTKEGKHKKAQYCTGDISRKNDLKQCFQEKDIEKIIHLAALMNGTAERVQEVNIEGTQNLLDLFNGEIISLNTGFIYQGQTGPYREDMGPLTPINDYGKTKLKAEELILKRNGKSVRTSIAYGPGQEGSMFIPSLKQAITRKETVKMTKGEQKRDFIHVQDLVRGIIAVMENKETGIFNIAYGESTELREVVTIAREIMGNFSIDTSVPYRENEMWDYSFDISKAKRVLDWQPQINLKQGLEQVLSASEESF